MASLSNFLLFIAVNSQYCSLLTDDEIFNITENLSLLAFSHSTQCIGAGYVYTIYIYMLFSVMFGIGSQDTQHRNLTPDTYRMLDLDKLGIKE